MVNGTFKLSVYASDMRGEICQSPDRQEPGSRAGALEVRVLHVSFSDSAGGASIAAMRLARAQRAAGIDARMLVVRKSGADDWVEAAAPAVRRRARAARFFARRASRLLAGAGREGMRTLAIARTGLGVAIEASGPDIVHWHWVGSEAVSLAEMARVRAPAVWTCHDEWAFAGAEHYADGDSFASDYAGCQPWDCDRWTFARKRRAWAHWSPALIGPSEWMARRARSSPLGCGRVVEAIPNTLDFEVFRPFDRLAARSMLGLPERGAIVLFGADDGIADPRKGFDLLERALTGLSPAQLAGLTLATFGGKTAAGARGTPAVSLGKVVNPAKLAAAYSAADVFVAPSRQDNLPNTMVEAQACGTPCVGFDVGGLSDIVAAPHHGTLVPPFDTSALGEAIVAHAHSEAPRQTIRADAVQRFGNAVVVGRHRDLYTRMLST